jgi:CBS domain-containing protein
MNERFIKAQKPERLEILLRRVEAGDGTMVIRACVECPEARGAVPIDECSACEACGGLESEPGGARASLLCYRGKGEPKLPAALSDAKAPGDRFTPAIAERMPVSAIMTRSVECVPAELEIDAVAAIFLEDGLSGMPVINRAGKPIGIISKTDLVREWYQRGKPREDGESYFPRLTAGEIMNPIVTVLHGNASIARAAALLASQGLHRIPVVGDAGQVIGLLSSTDILRWLATLTGTLPDA